MQMGHRFVWIDIPVLDLDRAIDFYSAVLGERVQKEKLENTSIGILPHGDGEISGCLYVNPYEKPSAQGPLIYMNIGKSLTESVQRVESKGGKILKDIHSIGPYGSRAIILDSEGNRLALHSR